jgi:hypothetical protein
VCSIPLRPAHPAGCARGWLAGSGPWCSCVAAVLGWWPLLVALGTFRLPVAPLQQLSLKVSPSVLDHWRAQAAAQGVSIRDWLVSISGPAAAHSVGPAASDGLADRVAQLEASTAELREAVARLEARPPRSPRAAPAPAAAALADLLADGIETADRAHRLGLKRGLLNNRIMRMGSPAPGLVVDGWRCVGRRSPERGDPPRALPVGPAHDNSGVMTGGGGMAGSSGKGGAGGGRKYCKNLSKQDAQRLLSHGHQRRGRLHPSLMSRSDPLQNG